MKIKLNGATGLVAGYLGDRVMMWEEEEKGGDTTFEEGEEDESTHLPQCLSDSRAHCMMVSSQCLKDFSHD